MLNKRIEFQIMDVDSETWQTEPYYQCWAELNGLFGSEYWAACAARAENTVNFTVRYCKSLEKITPLNFRIVYCNELYDIKHIDNIKFQNKWLKIKAVKKYENIN